MEEARVSSTLIFDMLARGIPLTLLPDLAWPGGIAEDDCLPERSACSGTDRHPARHADATGGEESFQQALAYAACPTGRHRRTATGRGRPPGSDGGVRRQG